MVLVTTGILLFLSPDLQTVQKEYTTNKYIEKFEEDNQTKKEDDPRYQECLEYNDRIYQNKQTTFHDAWTYVQSPIDMESFKDERFGYIKIPAMDVKLPLYMGASDENMSKGAFVLGGSSVPIGGINTNSIIGGHRGYQGMPYFREIEKLKPGDKVYVKNPWEKLTYVVETIKIIEPDDVDSLRIQEGRDMISLLTCHPYRSHGKQRYVVYCVRKGTPRKDLEKLPMIESSEPEIKKEKYFRLIIGILMILMIIETIILKVIQRKNRQQTQRNHPPINH